MTFFITRSLYLLTPLLISPTPHLWQPPICSLYQWACFFQIFKLFLFIITPILQMMKIRFRKVKELGRTINPETGWVPSEWLHEAHAFSTTASAPFLPFLHTHHGREDIQMFFWHEPIGRADKTVVLWQCLANHILWPKSGMSHAAHKEIKG